MTISRIYYFEYNISTTSYRARMGEASYESAKAARRARYIENLRTIEEWMTRSM